jgi:hypothetical protein
MSTLLVIGDAPCLEADLAAFGPVLCPVMAINRAGFRYLERIDYWCSYHPEKFWQEWRRRRAAQGANTDYQELCERDLRTISLSGSSTLLGVLWGLGHFGQVVVAGAPLIDEAYHQYRIGWENEAKHLRGRVISLSGWTKTFLEGLTWA